MHHGRSPTVAPDGTPSFPGRLQEMDRLEPTEVLIDALVPYLEVDRDGGSGAWVLANMVGTLAGSAATGGKVGTLSTPADASLFRALRAVADVVLVGAETVRREGYGPVRLDADRQSARTDRGSAPVPPLAIVSRSLDLDFDSPAFAEAATPTIVVTCSSAPADRLEVARQHAEVVVAGDERVDVGTAVAELAARGLRVILCEGGPTLLGELAGAGLLDELCLTIAPVLGGDDLPIARLPFGAELQAYDLAHVLIDDDHALFLRYTRAPARG
jgi:riboflavin biosynthesis pyrimidine reductase